MHQTARRILTFLLTFLVGSCATTPSAPPIPASTRPADITMNPDAGRGNWLFITLRMNSGKELPFFVDTGTSITCLDKSLEPQLGKRLGTGRLEHYGDVSDVGIYAAPALSLDGTPLMTGRYVCTTDLRPPAAAAAQLVMGILGLDCLQHYCLQLDFQARKLRFLDPALDAPGTPFPMTITPGDDGRPFFHYAGLFDPTPTDWLIDTGNAHDGDLDTAPFRRQVQQHTIHTDGLDPTRAWAPAATWNGQTYSDLLIGSGINSLGLRFFARHLTTLNFPRQTMYLQRITTAPLLDPAMQSAAAFLQQQAGQIPGLPQDDAGPLILESHPNSETYNFRQDTPTSTTHFRITRPSKTASWRLGIAWRTDPSDHLIEGIPLPSPTLNQKDGPPQRGTRPPDR